MSKVHILKIKGQYYSALFFNKKLCEIRKNDRDYEAGDRIKFEVVDQEERYEVASVYVITHVLKFPEGLKEGYVALSVVRADIFNSGILD